MHAFFSDLYTGLTPVLKEERDARKARGENVSDSEDELDLEEKSREMHRQKSEDKKKAKGSAGDAEAEDNHGTLTNATSTGKKGGRKKAAGASSVRERKSSGKSTGAKLRSQTEKPGSKRLSANGSGKRSAALTRSKSAVGSDLTGGSSSSSSSQTAKRKKAAAAKSKAKVGGAAGAKATKTTKKREKDVAKSVGGAREALQQARKLERTNSKAMMAAEAEKFGIGGKNKSNAKQTVGNVASASFMAMAGR